MLIFVIVWMGLAILFYVMGKMYVSINTPRRSRRQRELNEMQELLAENKIVFGRKNEGTSMDDKEVYAISPSDIGL